jgi:hypothetical protein
LSDAGPDVPTGGGALAGAGAVLREADTLLAEAGRRGLVLKLAGSAGVLRHCPGCHGGAAALGREPPGDLDFFAYRKQQRELGKMFAGLGYQADPAVSFSQEYGIDRQIYLGREAAAKVDVFLDALRMSHTIEFKGRLDGPGPTAEVADLLLAKLQIHEITEKDVKDIAALLAAHPLGGGAGAGGSGADGSPAGESGGGGRLDAGRVLGLMGRDWGLCHTALTNLTVAGELLAGWASAGEVAGSVAAGEVPSAGEVPLAGEVAAAAAARVAELRRRIEETPKSLRWKARASVGARVRWYEEVGDAEHRGQGDAGLRER